MKKIITAATMTVVLISGAVAAERSIQALKIGIVNPVEVYQNVPQGERSLKDWQAKLQPKADELQNKQSELFSQMQTLQNNAPTLTQKDLDAQKEKLTESQIDFKTEAQAFRQSEMQQEQAIAQAFQTSFNRAVSKVAKADHYSLILSSQAVAYSTEDVNSDVTQQVVVEMKAEEADESNKKLQH